MFQIIQTRPFVLWSQSPSSIHQEVFLRAHTRFTRQHCERGEDTQAVLSALFSATYLEAGHKRLVLLIGLATPSLAHGQGDYGEEHQETWTAHSNDFKELCYSETELLVEIIG